MYRGFSVSIPVGTGGYNGNRNVDQIPINQLVKAENIRFDGNAVIKAGGLKVYDSNAISGTPTCLAGHDWHPTTSVQRQVTAWSNGSIYKEAGGDQDNVTLASGLTISNPAVFIEGGQEDGSGNRKLFFYCDGVAPKVLAADGASMTDLTNVPADWAGSVQPAFAVLHDYRMWAFAPSSYPHSVYASKLDDHGDFSTGSPTPPIMQVAPGFSERISAAFPDIQQNSRQLYVFKFPYGIFRLDTTNIVSRYVPIVTVSRTVGCPGPNAITQVENDVWFIGQNGHIYSLSAVANTQNVQQADLTAALFLEAWTEDNVALAESDLKHARMEYDPRRKELYVMFRSKTSNYNAIGFVIDVRQENNPKISVEDRGAYFEAIWQARDTGGDLIMYAGGEGGVFYKMNDSDRLIGASTPYTGELETPETDFAFVSQEMRNKEKRFDWFEIDIIPTGNYNLNVEFKIDGETYRSDTINLGYSGSLLGTGTLGSFVLGGGGTIKHHKIPIGGSGRRLGVRLWNSDADQNFELTNMIVGFKTLGHEGES